MTSLTPNRDTALRCIEHRRACHAEFKPDPGLETIILRVSDIMSDSVLLGYADSMDAGEDPNDFMEGLAYALGHAIACISSTATWADDGHNKPSAIRLARMLCKTASEHAERIIAEDIYSEFHATVQTGSA